MSTIQLLRHKFKGWSHILFAACCGLIMTSLSWYLLQILAYGSSILREAVTFSMIVPIFLAGQIDPGHSHKFAAWCLGLTFIQWSAFGVSLSFFIQRLRHHNDTA